MKDYGAKISAVMITVFISFFSLSVFLRMFTREVLAERYGISNGLTRLVWFDIEDTGVSEEPDWAALYPFKEEDIPAGSEVKEKPSGDRITEAKNTLGLYTSNLLMGYTSLSEISAGYRSELGWTMLDRDLSAGLHMLDDGHLLYYMGKTDTAKAAENTISFSRFCQDLNIPFLYVQIPYKVCSKEDPEVSGIADFSEQNGDAMMAKLQEAGVEAYDLHQAMHEDGLIHHSLYFHTEHHWYPETGLWTAGKIAQEMNRRFDMDLPVSLLKEENFTRTVRKGVFLGDYGKTVTLLQTDPEDMTFYDTDFPVTFRYVIPTMGIDSTGDFTVVYPWGTMLRSTNLYKEHLYSAYMCANKPTETLINETADNDIHALILRDSYDGVVIPFLGLEMKQIDTLDLRYFTGSVQTYIEETRPDIVIVLYSILFAGDTDKPDHTSMFDFR